MAWHMHNINISRADESRSLVSDSGSECSYSADERDSNGWPTADDEVRMSVRSGQSRSVTQTAFSSNIKAFQFKQQVF